MSNWTLFSNHGHVLICLARNPESRLRDVATDVGITERAVQKIVRDLQDIGMISVTKHGRRNHYRIHLKQTLRHDLEAHCTLGELINFVNRSKPATGLSEKVTVDAPAPTPVRVEQVNPVAQNPEPREQPIEPPGVVKPEVAKEKPANTETENSIERQQGSLF